jgi:hypothetical protein
MHNENCWPIFELLAILCDIVYNFGIIKLPRSYEGRPKKAVSTRQALRTSRGQPRRGGLATALTCADE